ncbi:integrase core domain-containing protein [Lentzea sp.]|uniref:integrase core domain-containing protein n=1 Tax=Lentzea sp. TaxID=56099 RepID=UPI002ECFFE06
MNAITERWAKTQRTELLDRTLIWNETHLRHALREYERHYNLPRTHRSLAAAAPCELGPSLLNPTGSSASSYVDRIGSVEHFTSTGTSLDQHGHSFQHAQVIGACKKRKAPHLCR